MAGDPHWDKVVLAMHMDGANGSTVFTDQKGNTVTRTGDAKISTAQSKFGGGSLYLDGTGDALVLPAGTGSTLNLSSGAFTIECFYRTNSATSDQQIIAIGEPLVSANAHLQLALSHFGTTLGGKVRASPVSGPYQSAVDSTFSLLAGVWYHLAFVLDSTVRLYIDGVLQGTAPAMRSVLNTSAAQTLRIGSLDGAGAVRNVNGYVDDVRITKGVGRYTGNFTPPVLAFPNGPAMISGTTKDSAGAFAPRAVRVYRKVDGALAGAAISNPTTGVFTVPALDDTLHYAVAHDSDGDPYWGNVVLATHFDADSVIDPYASNVALGVHMDGTDTGTVFTDVTGKVMTANGNVMTSTANAVFGSTSAKFDGASDWISTPDTASLRMGGGAFTIEGWFHFGAVPAAGLNVNLVRKGNSGSSNFEYVFYLLNTAGVYTFCLATSTSGTVTATTSASSAWPPSLNNWVHLAVVRDGSTVRFFVNGAAFGTGTDATTWFGGAGVQTIGASTDGGSCLTGFIDDFRITKGVARYTSAFALPNVPFGSFKDLTGKDLMVIGVPSISTGTKKYGDASLSLSGTLTHLEVPVSTDFTFGSADFTVELYAYIASTSTAALIGMGTGNSPLLIYSTSGNLLLYASSTGLTWDVASGAVIKASFTTSQWYHIAICRKGGTLMAFLDGVNVLNIAVGTTVLTTPRTAIFVGSETATTNVLNGYIDDLRITKGVARYATNFTPPERAFSGPMAAGTSNALIFDDLTPD